MKARNVNIFFEDKNFTNSSYLHSADREKMLPRIYFKMIIFAFLSGLTGLSIGSTYAAFKKQGLLTYSVSTGASFFTISGLFFGKFTHT